MTRSRGGGRLRVVRRLGLDRNELRRRSDRVESAITVVLLLAFLVGVPSMGLLTARAMQRTPPPGERAAAARHSVTAELTAAAPDPRSASARDSHRAKQPTTARWAYGGVRHTGTVHVAAGTEAGTKVRIWVDDRGRMAGPPQAAATDHTRPAVLAGGLVMIAASVVLWFTRRAVRWAFIRRQLSIWATEWALVAPHWTGRR